MGFFDKIFGGKDDKSISEEDISQYLEPHAGDAINPPADFYIKRVPLRNEGDADFVLKELSGKNIIILDITPLMKQKRRLRNLVSKLKLYVEKINGDIALLSENLIILSPRNIKVVKSKK